MEAAHNPHRMATWEPLAVGTDHTQVRPGEIDAETTVGLAASVESLHSEFQQSADHLGEVHTMHEQVLVSAGMLPESHLAEVQPERQLKWMVEALHGSVNPDGLTIPLLGVTAKDVFPWRFADRRRCRHSELCQDQRQPHCNEVGYGGRRNCCSGPGR